MERAGEWAVAIVLGFGVPVLLMAVVGIVGWTVELAVEKAVAVVAKLWRKKA